MAETIERGTAPAPLAPAKHPRWWPWALAAAVIALGVGIGIGAASHTSVTTKTVAGPTVYQTVPGPTVTQTVTQTVTASPPAPAAGSVIFTASGYGNGNTKQFTVPDPGNYDVQWTYNQGSMGSSNFDIQADNSSDMNFTGPNIIGASGSGVTHVYNDPGTHYLTIMCAGSWTMKVVTTS